MSRWFRHYAGLCRDEKLVSVAIKAKQPIERVVWVWAAILESAAEIDDGGRYELDPAEAAYFLRADEDDIVSVEEWLSKSGRLADGFVVNWCNRQFQSDRSKERVAAHRERKRAARASSEPPTISSNDDVTLQKRHCNSPDTDTDTDTDITHSNARDDERDFRFSIADEYKNAGFLPPDTGRCVIWLQNGWQKSICVETVRALLAKKRKALPLSYIEPAIADAHAPLPVGQARAGPAKPQEPFDPFMRALMRDADARTNHNQATFTAEPIAVESSGLDFDGEEPDRTPGAVQALIASAIRRA